MKKTVKADQDMLEALGEFNDIEDFGDIDEIVDDKGSKKKTNFSVRRGDVMDIPVAKKKDIVKKMSEISGYRQSVCSEVFEAYVQAIKELITEENHVSVRGLGTFVLRKTQRRVIPIYGKLVEVRPMKKIFFEVTETLRREIGRERLNEE